MRHKTSALMFTPAAAGVAVTILAGCGIRIPDPAVRYIAFGDSTTAGPAERNYPDILREKLGEPDGSFANEGHGGESTDEGLVRLRELLADDLFPNATVLLYWEGGNDVTDFIKSHDPFLLLSPDEPDYPFADALSATLADIRSNVEDVIETATQDGLDVFVATYFPISHDVPDCDPLPFDILLPGQAQRANVYVAMLNESVREAARNRGAAIVEIAASGDVLLADPENYVNCNHLSSKGNEIVAEIFNETIAP